MSNALLDVGDLTRNKSSKVPVSMKLVFLLEKMENKCVNIHPVSINAKKEEWSRVRKQSMVWFLLLYKGKVIDQTMASSAIGSYPQTLAGSQEHRREHMHMSMCMCLHVSLYSQSHMCVVYVCVKIRVWQQASSSIVLYLEPSVHGFN